MYIEKRKLGKSTKYYLVHSYRWKDKVRKIRRYLGLNLPKYSLNTARQQAEHQIKGEIEELNTEIFNFSLSQNQLEKINKYEEKLKIYHFDKKNWQSFTTDFIYNTNAIEGSTVQLGDVDEILHKNKPGNDDELETKGVARAVEFIRNTKEDLSLSLIKNLHKLCFEGSKPYAGQFRKVEVVIRNSKGEIIHSGIPSSHLAFALDEFIAWYKKNKNKFRPLVQAAIIHNQFETIHPFQDGNGRVGRLLLNFILLRNKYPPINISLEDRGEYYSTLQEYQKHHDLKPTIKFLIKQYNKTLKRVTTKIKN